MSRHARTTRGIGAVLAASAIALGGCSTTGTRNDGAGAMVAAPDLSTRPATRPAAWGAPEVLVELSALRRAGAPAVDPQGRPSGFSAGLALPGGLKIDGNDLWVADIAGLLQVDAKTGAVREVFRTQRDAELEYPLAVGLSATRFALSSWFAGSVQLIDRGTLKTLAVLRGLKSPVDAIPMPDGSLIYAEFATGSVTRASGAKFDNRQVLASGLGGPVQIVIGRDGALYLTEAAGRLTRIPLDASAPLRAVAEGLAMPEGLAQTPWGSFVVAESAARRLVEIDPANGMRRTVAENLPIGLPGAAGAPPHHVPTGVAVGSDGTIYMSADRNNALYRIRPQR